MRSYSQMLDFSALKFMVIDDNAFMLQVATAVLNALGIRKIDIFKSGKVALADLKSSQPDIILVNWGWASNDGLAFTRAVRRLDKPNLAMTPIIMMSAHSGAAKVEEARDSGITEFLAKPIAATSLYLRIEEIIMRPRAFIKSPGYIGPDRHRHSGKRYEGELRRQGDPVGGGKEDEPDGRDGPGADGSEAAVVAGGGHES